LCEGEWSLNPRPAKFYPALQRVFLASASYTHVVVSPWPFVANMVCANSCAFCRYVASSIKDVVGVNINYCKVE